MNPSRRSFLTGSAVWMTALSTYTLAQAQQAPVPPSDRPKDPPPTEPPASKTPEKPAEKPLIDDEGREYRVCPQCAYNMYKQGRMWVCENCGYSYVE